MSDAEDSVRKPRRQEAISRAVEAFGKRLPKALPAKVVRVDAAKRAVDCKVLVMRPFFDEDEARQVESIPVIPNVAVVLPPMFAPPISDGTLTFGTSVLPATTGFVVWCDRSIDKWLTGNGGEVDPEFDHNHALTDAFFIPGGFAFGAVPFALPQSSILIGDDTSAPAAARVGDGVGNGTLQIAFAPGSGAATLSITYTPGDGSLPQNISGTGGTLTLKEKIQSGSLKIKIA